MNDELTGFLANLKGKIEYHLGLPNKGNLLKAIIDEISLFNKGLDNFCSKKASGNNNGLNKNDKLFKLMNNELSELKDNSNKISEGDDMIPETNALAMATKVAIAGGTLLIIGIAITLIYAKRKKIQTEIEADEEQKTNTSSPSLMEKISNILPSSKSNDESYSVVTPSYEQYHLLLIIPDNQLAGLGDKQWISNEQVNNLISHAIRAYCFSAKNDNEDNEVLENVKYDDGKKVDFTTSNNVFVHLRLWAEPSVEQLNESNINELSLREKIKSSSADEIEVIQKNYLEDPKSTSKFYRI